MASNNAIDEDDWSACLQDDECLLWRGRPAGGIRFDHKSWVRSGFGVIVTAFVVFGMIETSSGDGNGPFGGVPFVVQLGFLAFGAFLVFGHLYWDMFVRSRTAYALSDRRALIAKHVWSRRIESFPINAETRLAYSQGSLSTILFAGQAQPGPRSRLNIFAFFMAPTRYRITPDGFRFIADGDHVYRLMLTIRQGQSERAPD